MSVDSHIATIKNILLTFKEEHLWPPLKDLFSSKGYQTRITHGSHERGRDLIATKPNDYNLLISVKRVEIDNGRWDDEVLSSIHQMITRPIDYAGVDENLTKKILLVFTGYLTTALAELIEETNIWSKKHHSPVVEVWDIEVLATEFYDSLLKIDLKKEGAFRKKCI